jgi:ATP-dependent Zn protease
VTISAKDVSGGSFLTDLAVNFPPIALLVGVLFLMGRLTQKGQQSLFGFGGSRARVYNQERPGVTFADGQVKRRRRPSSTRWWIF